MKYRTALREIEIYRDFFTKDQVVMVVWGEYRNGSPYYLRMIEDHSSIDKTFENEI
jgi:hypothetical protein